MIDKSFGEKLDGVAYKVRYGVYALIQQADGKIATVKTPRGYFFQVVALKRMSPIKMPWQGKLKKKLVIHHILAD